MFTSITDSFNLHAYGDIKFLQFKYILKVKMMPVLVFSKNCLRSNCSDINCDEFDEIYNIQVISISLILMSNTLQYSRNVEM